MSWKRTLAVVLRQFYLIRGSVSRAIPLFAWAAVDMFLWGFLTRYLNTVTRPGFDLVPALLGAVLLWDFFIRIMHGIAMAFLEDVWSRNFLNIFATPLLVREYVAGLVLSSIATSVAGLLVMLAIAAAFNLSFLVYGLMVLPFLLVLFLFGISIGVFGSALVLRFGPASEWFIWPLPALLSPFVGVLYPVATLPHWMQGVSRCLPPSYVFEALRAIVTGSPVSGWGIVTGGMLAVGYVLLSYFFFTKVYEDALRTGLIARYSAENLG